MKTSKIMLALWLALGAGLLAFGDFDQSKAMVWGLGLLIVAWNRLDSRRQGYTASVRFLGMEASVRNPERRGEGDVPSQDPGDTESET